MEPARRVGNGEPGSPQQLERSSNFCKRETEAENSFETVKGRQIEVENSAPGATGLPVEVAIPFTGVDKVPIFQSENYPKMQF